MFELPLFPLNTVLFPGMPISLHVFEDRYKLMIGKCIQERRPFGVVLIREGVEALGPLAQPHSFGCMATITQVERLEHGRMNIGAIGRERFRILTLDDDLPYLVAKVERFPLANDLPQEQVEAAEQLLPLVTRYMDSLSQVENVTLDPEKLPSDPPTLAYLAATLVQIPQEEKQKLLSTEKTVILLEDLRTLYRREVTLVAALLEEPVEQDGLFSLN
jgi:Lon protease-like protein